MKNAIKNIIQESLSAKNGLLESQEIIESIEKSIKIVIGAFKNGKKVIIFGNGGSAGDAQHFVGEMVNRFKINRRPLPAISLVTDTSVLSSIANDCGYDYIFSKQIEALGEQGDVAIAITTSDVEIEKGGHSANIANGLLVAKEKGLKTIGLFSQKSEKAAKMVDLAIMVPSINTPRVQEMHIMVIHIICEIVENALFSTI